MVRMMLLFVRVFGSVDWILDSFPPFSLQFLSPRHRHTLFPPLLATVATLSSRHFHQSSRPFRRPSPTNEE
jgi:hypothetical protein